jgi:hypothetical protein
VIPRESLNLKSQIFSDTQIGDFAVFAGVLGRIHRRLEYEGFTFESGIVNPPPIVVKQVKSPKQI